MYATSKPKHATPLSSVVSIEADPRKPLLEPDVAFAVPVGDIKVAASINSFQQYNALEQKKESNMLEKPIIISDIIKPFLEWCYQDAFDLTVKSRLQKSKEITAASSGIIIGSLAVASTYPLGGSFGNVVSDHLGITDPTARRTIYGFFATNALIPMLCLSCIEAKDLFRRLASSSSGKAIITKEDRKYLRRGLACIAYILAAFSALPSMYATIVAFQNSDASVKWLTIPASFIGGLIFRAASELRLVDRALTICTPEEKYVIKQMRKDLREKFLSVVTIIKRMRDEELDGLFFDVLRTGKGARHPEQKQQEAHRHLHHIVSLPKKGDSKKEMVVPNKPAPRQKQSSCMSYFFKGTGFLIGAASSYVYYTLAESAALYLCDYVGITDEGTRKTLKQFTSSLAVIPWATLGAEATQAVFEKAYNFFRCQKHESQSTASNGYCIPIFSLFEGICAATPPVYLVIQALTNTPWYAKLLIIPAFLGPASIRTVAVSRLMEEGVNYIKEFKTETTGMKKEKLIEAISKIATSLDKMPDDQLIPLYFDLMRSHPTMFNKNFLQRRVSFSETAFNVNGHDEKKQLIRRNSF